MNEIVYNRRIDWVTTCLYILFVCLGWINIYASSAIGTDAILDFSKPYGKQLYWIIFTIPLIVLCLSIKPKIIEQFSSIFYVLSIFLLIGLFVFGISISGAQSWYQIGPMRFQPSELAKLATALALAKYLENNQTQLTSFKHQLSVFNLLFIPVLLIILQSDPGSALIFAAFLLALHREHLPPIYLITIITSAIIFILTISFGDAWVISFILIFALLAYFRIYGNKKKKLKKISLLILTVLLCISFSLLVDYVFQNIFDKHHRDRFNILLGKSNDFKGVGYNLEQSLVAIGSGGLFGKGFREGTQTKGNFVPEQHTDFIFSTIGEEWGFVGTTFIVILFGIFLLRLIFLAERQKKRFYRFFGYAVASIFFIHFFINIAMVIGLMPTIGIPLPFLSYGGSALWSFTTMLFLFLRMDAGRAMK